MIDNIGDEDISNLLESHVNFNDAYSRIFDDKDYSWNKPHFITLEDNISVINMNTSWLDPTLYLKMITLELVRGSCSLNYQVNLICLINR